MAVKVRIDTIDRDVKLIFDELLSPKGRSAQFAAGAQEILTDTDQTNRQVLGRIPRNQTYVDGREGAALATVKPDGVIVRDYELVFDVLVFIGELLRTTSPVGRGPDKRPGHPGFYKASHILFADGVEVPITEQVPDAREYVFLSTAPYARRIENRSTIYEMAAAKASRRFGNIAKVYFSWRSPLLSYVQGGRNRAERAAQRNNRAHTAAKGIERASRVPAIIVTMGR